MNRQFETVDGTVRHEISVTSSLFDVHVGMAGVLVDGFSIYGDLGGMLMMSSSFEQTETLVEPQDVEFIDGSSTWNNADVRLRPTHSYPTCELVRGMNLLFQMHSHSDHSCGSRTRCQMW